MAVFNGTKEDKTIRKIVYFHFLIIELNNMISIEKTVFIKNILINKKTQCQTKLNSHRQRIWNFNSIENLVKDFYSNSLILENGNVIWFAKQHYNIHTHITNQLIKHPIYKQLSEYKLKSHN